MAVKYADSVYSFRNRTSLISQFVNNAPDAATLAQIESDLSDAAKAYYQRNYQDAIDLYKQAGVLIYSYIDPMASVYSPGAWTVVSKNPALFDPILSAACVHLSVLPIPSPNPIRASVAATPAQLGSLSLLKKPSGHEIGVPMKAMVDDVRCSNRAPLSCYADSPHGL